MYEEGISNFQAEVLAVNQALETLLDGAAAMRATLFAEEEAAASEYMASSLDNSVYSAGLESSIRQLLHEAGARDQLLLSQEELVSVKSSSLDLSVAKKGELDTLLASLGESLQERNELAMILGTLSCEAGGEAPGVAASHMVAESLVEWASLREEAAHALLSYRDRVEAGEIARGEGLPEEDSPGYAEISLWAASPVLDTTWPDELLADSICRTARAEELAALLSRSPSAPESTQFATQLDVLSRHIDDLEGLEKLAGIWMRSQDIAARDLAAAQAEVETACNQWTLPEDLPDLYRDSEGLLRLHGEEGAIEAPESLNDDVIDWVCRMNERSFDVELLKEWALARSHVLSMFDEGALSSLSVGEAAWLANTVGQKKVDGVSLSSVLETYRNETRVGLAQEAWEALDETSQADIEMLVLLESGGSASAIVLGDKLRMVLEELEFTTVDVCISDRLDTVTNKAENNGILTSVLYGFTLLNIWNPLGAFSGALTGLFGVSTIINVEERDTLREMRASYEDAWAALIEERECGSDFFAQTFCDFAALVDTREDLLAAEAFRSDPANAQTVWGDFAAQLPSTMDGESVPVELCKLVDGILESGESFSGGPLLPIDALREALSTRYLDLAAQNAQLEALLRQQHDLDFMLSESLAAGAMDWVCGFSSAVDPAPFIEGILHENERVSNDQIASFKALRARLTSLAPAGTSHVDGLFQPVEILLSSMARGSLAQADSLAAFERVRARSELASLEASQILFASMLDDLASSGLAALSEAAASLDEINAEWLDSCSVALQKGSALWDEAWQEHLIAREVWLNDCVRSWQDGVSDTACSIMIESGCREARSLDTLLVAPALLAVDDRTDNLTVLVENLRAELSLPSATQALYGHISTSDGNDKGEPLAFESLLTRSLEVSRACSASLAERNRRDLLALNELASLAALEQMAEAFIDNLAAVNGDFDASMDELFVRENKWQRSGGMYRKDYVVHATLIDPLIHQSGEVSVYDPLSPEECGYEGLEEIYESSERNGAIDEAFSTMEALFATVFGSDDEEGLVFLHIGTAPGCTEDVTEEGDALPDTEGSGELGRLVGACITVMREEAEGWAKAAASWYDKPFADDRSGAFSWLKSCSVRSIVDVAVGVAASACTAGLGGIAAIAASTALSLGDDILFSMADIMGGADVGTVMVNLGKQTLMSAAMPAIGGGLDALSSVALESATGFMGFVANATFDTVRVMSCSTVKAAISAVGWDGDGFTWSNEAFSTTINAGFPAAMAGLLVKNGLNSGLEGFTGDLLVDARTLSSFAGGLVGEAVRYKTEGKMSFNILNAADVTKGEVQADIIRLDIGADGASVQLGTGGQSAGVSTISSALEGVEAWGVNARLLIEGGSDLSRYQSALRTLYCGNPEMQKEFEALLAGGVQVREDTGLDAAAQSVYDEKRGTKVITLGKEAIEDGSRFGLNLVFAHESQRNGIVDDDLTQQIETAEALNTQLSTAGALAAAWGMGSLSFEQQTRLDAFVRAQSGDWNDYARLLSSFDSSADFWRLLQDGTIEWDGRRALYDHEDQFLRLATDENGRSLGYGASLLEYMGIPGARDLLESRGIATAGLDSEGLARELMNLVPVEWQGDNGPVDPGLDSLMADSSINYYEKKAIWLEENWALSSSKLAKILSDGAGLATFDASTDVLQQVDLRNYILAEMNKLGDLSSWSGDYDPAREAARIESFMAFYNKRYVDSALAFTPENFISQDFMNELDKYRLNNGSSVSYIHAGIDTVGSNEVVSPGFFEVLSWEGQAKHELLLGLAGSDIHNRFLHLDPGSFTALSTGDTLLPGDSLGEFGTEGNSSGAHLHVETTLDNSKGERGFVNPLVPDDVWQNRYNFPFWRGKLEDDGTWTTLEKYRSVIPR